ncbi:AMP-binding protein [Methylosinus sp. Sm6]|uniref:AMP-binding protein n=1 Tax=Methylosinus sp. Sm6 TaxID=2866948 RepID=UPI001C999D4F|nr:AMP-binding protein [Methylosinus sp. Sm6]
MPVRARGAGSHPQSSEAAQRELVAVVAAFARELHPSRAQPSGVALSSRLEQDLGVDSLARAELILRLERRFRRRLPIEAMGRAETVEDVLAALEDSSGEPLRVERAQAAALPPAEAAAEARTLVEALEWHVARHPDRLHLTFLADATTAAGALTYGRLAAEARRAAAGLATMDIEPGDRIALMLPTGLDFFIGFFGALYAGAVPVPIYPPMRLSQIEDHLRRQIGILRNAGVKVLITAPEAARLAALARSRVETLERIVVVDELTAAGGGAAAPLPRDERATAMLQYTSGSTGDPKGVVLSHANLLANIRAMGAALRASSADVFVSWLPLYHDMGLIGAWFGCLYFGAPLYVMSPLTFLARPAAWLWAIHAHRGTLSAAPNFAFELCLDKIDASELEGLDLRSLRFVANGAEPVGPRTIRRFAEKFAPFGFRPDAMAPVYGLAENAVGLAFPPLGRAPPIERVDRDALALRGAAEPALPGAPHALELVACGQPLPLHEIRIVDEAGRELGERREGRLEFRGPSATAGYFRNEAKTRELIRGGWLDSGDRAYLSGGDVFVTGRIKDILIRAGRHLYPQEIEAAIGEIDGIRKGCVAVFGVADPGSGTERIVIVAETYATTGPDRAALAAKAQETMSAIGGTPADDIVLVPPRTTPKTSSGKIRRSAARELYEQGRLGAPPRAVWLQLARLALAGLRPGLGRLAGRAGDWAYAAWWWLVIACGYAAAWITVMATPGLERRWTATRRIARAMLAALGAPVSAEGSERLPDGGAMLVFNHSSYMDVALLAAFLPGAPAYVAKRELARQLFAGPFLSRLGVLFVERFDAVAGAADAERLAAAARGRNLVFFPEGTFTRRPGLGGFYLGAFKIAAAAGLPVYPGVLRGTRSMLRSDQWFPRRAALSLRIEPPIRPEGTDFSAALKLRDAARAEILARCGEPDVDELVKPRGQSATRQ